MLRVASDGWVSDVVKTLRLAAPMWDLSLASVHTFAVGDVQAVVHNCPENYVGAGGGGGGPQLPATTDEINEGAQAIKNHPPFVTNYSSDYQWDYHHFEGPDAVVNPYDHDPAFTMRYYFYFDDAGTGGQAMISMNFDPVAREWETGRIKFSSWDTEH